jgi:hypothetical protein
VPTSWLPDSRRLIFTSQTGLYIVDIGSGIIREILSLAPDDIRWATVSRDGQTLYFTRSSAEADVWMLTLNEEQ